MGYLESVGSLKRSDSNTAERIIKILMSETMALYCSDPVLTRFSLVLHFI